MPEPLLPAALQPLLADNEKDISKGFSDAKLRAVTNAREELVKAHTGEESGIHDIVRNNFGDITSQYRSAEDIQQKLSRTQDDLRKLQATMAETDALTRPLLSLLQSRSQHTINHRSSSAHLSALLDLQTQAKKLKRLEARIRAGEWDLQGKEREFWEGNGWVRVELQNEVLRHSRIASQLVERARFLRGLYVAQLEEGFRRCFEFGGDAEHPRLMISTRVRLKSKTESGKKAPIEPEPVSLQFLLSILNSYNALQPLLESIRQHLLDTLLSPLLAHRADKSRLAAVVTANPEKFEAVLERQENDPAMPDLNKGVYEDVQKILDVVDGALGGVAGAGGMLQAWRTAVIHDVVTILLEKRIKPSSPSSRYVLSKWATSIASAADFEDRLYGRVDGSGNQHLIRHFYENEAGLFWAMTQKAVYLEQARKIIAGSWDGWESVEVKKDRIIQPAVQAEPVSGTSDEPVEMLESRKEGSEDSGWGFDEDWSNNEDKASTQKAPMETPTGETGSGWGFDDEDLSTPAAPAPAPVEPAKPIRQARKLGKKGKQTAQQMEDEVASMSSSMHSETANSTSAKSEENTSVVPDEPWVEAEGWDAMPSEPSATHVQPEPAGPTIITERYQVSKACDTLLAIMLEVLEISEGLSSMSLSGSSFQNIGDVMQSTAPAIVDLFADLMPRAHAAQIDHVPALAMQFSNDCLQIADVVESMAQTSSWVPNESVERLRELSDIAFAKQVTTQKDGLRDDISGLDGLEGGASDHTFERQKQVMSQMHHKLTMLHRVWSTLLTEGKCLESMGQLVEAAVSQIADHIIAISDITADESERIKKLCDVLRPVEEIFTQHGANIVAFVPHWLRFCYVSEIMEASLADITYLFESGALVDFTPDELVHLLFALFTDTPLRRDVISKITASRRSSV